MSENRDNPAPWHSCSQEEVLQQLSASPTGLNQTEAQRRLQSFGANRLAESAQQGLLLRFLRQFHNILIYVLLGAAFITALLSHWMDTVVILAVVIANAIIGFIQEGSSILLGSFRLYVILEFNISRASSLTIMVLQGVVSGVIK